MTRDGALYEASAPVLAAFVARIPSLLRDASGDDLRHALIDGIFDTGQQFLSAIGFSLRATLPLIGEARDDPEADPHDPSALTVLAIETSARLEAMTRDDFAGSADRTIEHLAGEADLAQPAADYLHHFALPNFFFHLSLGYAGLRAQGLPVGKADFDGLHRYIPGFRF